MTATMRAVVLDAPAGGRMPWMDGLEAVGSLQLRGRAMTLRGRR